jgi:hypothetical protein
MCDFFGLCRLSCIWHVAEMVSKNGSKRAFWARGLALNAARYEEEARKSGLDFLAYLISLVRHEATNVAEREAERSGRI